MSSFFSLLSAADLVLGIVLAVEVELRTAEVPEERLGPAPGLVTPVLMEPFLYSNTYYRGNSLAVRVIQYLDMVLVCTELRDALELDLLRFSLLLLGCCLLGFILGTAAVAAVRAVLRAFRIFSVDL